VSERFDAAAPAGRPYTQLLRSSRHRWWRSLLSLLVAAAGVAALVVLSSVALLAAALTGLVDTGGLETQLDEPWVLLSTNLLLGAAIGVSVLAVWVGHGYRPRWVSTVVGGLRWGWMLRCAGVALVVAVASTAVFWLADGAPSGRGSDVAVLLVIVALTTPLQAAGEEYFFRGWMSQSIGALFPRAVVGAVVAAGVSAALFALAHGGQDAFLFADRLAFGLLASYLVWRTGGLEAAIAAHTVNNVVVFVPVILTGGLSAAMGVSQAGAGVVGVDVVSMVVLGAALTWLARRSGVRRRYVDPPDEAVLLAPSSPSGSLHPR
jgi:membrane protease YdiL (CAAX protease family)